MNKKLKEKIKEALSSVLPITATVLVLSVFLEIDIGIIGMFLMGALLLIVGMGFFTLGADIAMLPMGEGIGIQLTKTKKLWLIAIITFVMGVIITIAEPDLQVLANQTVSSVPKMTLILTVAVGVGIFLVSAILRVLFRVSLSKLLIAFYFIVFALSAFVPNNFVSIAFDSGGVTTGPITVPFIMAMGLGIASIRSDKESKDDSFGFVALSSIGPILAVLILGICYNAQEFDSSLAAIPTVGTMRDVFSTFAHELPAYSKEVMLALLPIVAVLVVFQVVSRRYKKRQLLRVVIGFVYTIIGLILFLVGVNVGFIPVGQLLGGKLASAAHNWLLVPVGMVMGYFVVAAEPAVHVLNKQVEEVSEGTIPSSVMQKSLSFGVAVSLGIAMVRILTGISIYWVIIPGYIIALTLTFFVPKIFSGIAFDSGGVASGPMTTTFLLPFAIGACVNVPGSNILTDAFGVVAMVAMTPLIAIQILGLVFKIQMKKAALAEKNESAESYDDIIEFEEDLADE